VPFVISGMSTAAELSVFFYPSSSGLGFNVATQRDMTINIHSHLVHLEPLKISTLSWLVEERHQHDHLRRQSVARFSQDSSFLCNFFASACLVKHNLLLLQNRFTVASAV